MAILTDGIAPFETGGMQTYCSALVKELIHHNVTVQLFHTTLQGDEKGAMAFRLPEPHTVVYEKYPERKRGFLHYIHEQYELSEKYLSQILKMENKPDVIYAHGFTACHKGFQSVGIPVVINLHGMNMYQPVKALKAKLIAFFLRRLAGKTFNNASGIITLGNALTAVIPKKFSAKKHTEIPCAVSEEYLGKISVCKTKPVKFLFVGRNDYVKGMDVLIKSIEACVKTGRGVRFTIVGDWNPALFKGIEFNVTLLGKITSVAEMKKIYQEHHVFVLPSYSEGFPISILEALASGCYVIATGVGCVPEIANNSVISLIHPGNAEELKDAILKAETFDDTQWDKIKEDATRIVGDKYTWPLVAAKTKEFLTEFII